MDALARGVPEGLQIAVLALAFWITYSATRVIHLALGAIFVIAPLVMSLWLQAALSTIPGVLISMIAGTLISLGCEVLNHRRLETRRASWAVHLASSLGIYVSLVQVAVLVGGNETRQLHQSVSEGLVLGSTVLAQGEVMSVVISVAVIAGTALWLRSSNLALRLRALGDNSRELSIQGLNTNALRCWAFGISGLLCAAGSLTRGFDVGTDPQKGLVSLMPAMVAVFVGKDLGFAGVIFVGIALGVVRSTVVLVASAQWQEAVTFGVLMIFLLTRSQIALGTSRAASR